MKKFSLEELFENITEVGKPRVEAENKPTTLSEARRRNLRGAHTTIPHEQRIKALMEYLADYQKTVLGVRAPMTPDFPFKPGDFVTPRADTTNRWVGLPMIVLEVNGHAEPVFTGSEHHGFESPNYGIRPNLRIAHYDDSGIILRYWNEAIDFETWFPKSEDSDVGKN